MATCSVTGTLKDPSETAIVGATVRAVCTTPFFVGTSLIMPTELSTTTDSSGAFSLSLSQSQSFIVTVEYPPNALDSSRKYKYAITTPATASASLSTLATEL